MEKNQHFMASKALLQRSHSCSLMSIPEDKPLSLKRRLRHMKHVIGNAKSFEEPEDYELNVCHRTPVTL